MLKKKYLIPPPEKKTEPFLYLTRFCFVLNCRLDNPLSAVYKEITVDKFLGKLTVSFEKDRGYDGKRFEFIHGH